MPDAASSAQKDAATRAEELSGKAAALYSANDPAGALKLLSEAIYLDPLQVDNRLLMARCYRDLGKHGDALHSLDTVESISPGEPIAALLRGICLWETGKPEEAVPPLAAAIATAPDRFDSYYYRALALRDGGRWLEATADCDEMIKLDASFADAFLIRAGCRAQAEDYAQAVEDYTHALELASGSAGVYSKRADCFVKLERYEEALRDYDSAIALEPGEAEHFVERAFCHFLSEQWDLARKDIDQALKLAPDVAPYHYIRASIYEKLYRTDEALAEYTHCIELDPHYAAAYAARAELQLQKKLYETALADYKRALELAPDNTEYLFQRAVVYRRIEDYQSLLADALALVERPSHRSTGYYLKGLALHNLSRNKEAVEAYNQAVALEGEINIMLADRGEAYIAIHNYREAAEDFTRAIELGAENKRSLMEKRCKCYIESSQYDKALADVNQLIARDPYFSPQYYWQRADIYRKQGRNDLALADEQFGNERFAAIKAAGNAMNASLANTTPVDSHDQQPPAVKESTTMSASSADSRVFKVIELFDKRWTGADADVLIGDLRVLSTSGLEALAKQTGMFQIQLAVSHLIDSNDDVEAVELALLVHLFIALQVNGAGVPPSLRSECIARYGSAAIRTVEEVVPQQIEQHMREMGASSAQIQAVLSGRGLPAQVANAERAPARQTATKSATMHSGETVCPHCGRADAIQKVSSVLSGGVVNVRTEGSSGYRASSTSVSDLAAQMRLPEPESHSYGTVGCLGVFGLMILLGAGAAGGGAAIVGLIMLAAAGFWAWQMSSSSSAARDEHDRLTSGQNRLYYCHRCDVVFLPGNNRVASPSSWRSLV